MASVHYTFYVSNGLSFSLLLLLSSLRSGLLSSAEMVAIRSVSENVPTKMVGTWILFAKVSLAVTALKGNAPLTSLQCLVDLIYMSFKLSGAHYNPAVSLFLSLQNRSSYFLSVNYSRHLFVRRTT